MKWHVQVAHVVRKDLYLSRWFLLAYALVVLGATAVAVGWSDIGTGASLPWTFSLVLLGMIMLALLVQADSPQRSNAFWVTLPLHRSAVFAAKVTSAILFLLVLPLVGQLGSLYAHAVPAVDLPALLGRSALVYGAWLGLGAVIAALTPDLRTFAVALTLVILGGVVSPLVVDALLESSTPSVSPAPLLWTALPAGGALFVLAHQYRTRNVRRGVWIAALLWLAVLVLPFATGRSVPAVHLASGSIPHSLRPVTLGVSNVQFRPRNEIVLDLQLSGISASHQYLLVSPVAYLQMPDGSSVRLEVRSANDSYIWLNDPIPRLDEGLTWLGQRAPPREMTTGIRVDLSPDQRAVLARRDARLTVRGHLEVREARIRAELPLGTGARAAFEGQRVRVLQVENIEEGPTLEVQVSSVVSPRSYGAGAPPQAPTYRAVRFALVNQETHEAIALSERNGSGTSFTHVLPGVQSSVMTHGLQQNPWDSYVQVGDDWLRQSRLLLIEWAPVGSDLVMIPATVPGAGLSRRGQL